MKHCGYVLWETLAALFVVPPLGGIRADLPPTTTMSTWCPTWCPGGTTNSRPRKAYVLWETLAALLVLSVLTTLCLQFFAAADDQRRAVFSHLAAVQEAANLLERSEALPWNDLTPQETARLRLSAEARRILPEGRIAVLVNAPSGTPLAKRVAASVYWRPQPNGPEREARLVAWRYKTP